jgi:RimK family alpha-L-glutamate ligase
MDIFLFRAYNLHTVEAKVIAERLLAEGKVVIDEVLAKRFVPSKAFEASRLGRQKIPVLETYQALSFDGWKTAISKVKYPVVVKPVNGQKGQGVRKLESEKAARDFFRKNPEGYLLQPYLPQAQDLRIFVVGRKVLGGIRRYGVENDFRANISLGGRAEKIEIDPPLRKLALSAARTMGCEIAGVDILRCCGRLHVLEVNATPQWQGFKEATGINPADFIIDYALDKYGRQQIKHGK